MRMLTWMRVNMSLSALKARYSTCRMCRAMGIKTSDLPW